MVVTRRAPAAPASRTNSSQPTPRLASGKGKGTAGHQPESSSPLANGESSKSGHDAPGSRDVDDSSKKGSKNKSKFKQKKGGKKRKGGGATLADVLLRYLLLFFTIYSLSVCPSDVKLQSPVCRGLAEYRRLILEPYILPTINTALAHPSIAPYVQRAKPYAERAVEIATPIVIRSHKEWNSRVVPQWQKRVVPQYHKYVVPELHKAAAYIEPYTTRVEQEYEKYLGPYLRQTVAYAIRAEQIVEPYVILAINKSYQGWHKARPYVGPVIFRFKLVLKHLLAFLQVQRRKFVDPHVAKIWERVLELSSGSPSLKSKPVTSAPSASVTSSAVEEPTPEPQATPTPSKADSSSVDEGPADPSPEAESVDSSVSVSETSSETVSASTIAEPPATSSSVASVSLESVHAVSEPSETAAAPAVTLEQATDAQVVLEADVESVDAETTDIDLDAFAADLGLDDVEEPEPEPEEEPEAAQPTALTEEEEAERLRLKKIETAEKRANIMGRHTVWEEKVEALIKDNKKVLRKRLVALRKAAVDELKSSPEIKKNVDGLLAEAEKFLKGAEAYIKNLQKNQNKAGDKQTLLEKVVSKIEDKFSERLRETEALVDEWYSNHLSKEAQEVETVTAEVRDLADTAQADIGIDYVWLDDVTYADWQRYHDLLRRSDNFTEHAWSVQNGTHPSPPVNPVPAAIEELQTDVQDIVLGFESRLHDIKRKGEHAVGAEAEDGASGTHAGEDAGAGDAEDPQVSILPIADEPAGDDAAAEQAEAFIGRGKEEVEEAFARAKVLLEEAERARATRRAEAHAAPSHEEL
ncbi:hypothetical protein DENSPDRAFT_815552 [Dentipellis sp. KUC8613]|nr:hypothetical protein DENSPDRAFT_815552 [Dentipellis sp. KUC8613]